MKVIGSQLLRDGTEAVALEIPGLGTGVIVMPVIPDNAPQRIKEGIARRRNVYLSDDHRCPCGAVWRLPNRAQRRAAQGKVTAIPIVHENGCPAEDDALDAAIRDWKRGAL